MLPMEGGRLGWSGSSGRRAGGQRASFTARRRTSPPNERRNASTGAAEGRDNQGRRGGGLEKDSSTNGSDAAGGESASGAQSARWLPSRSFHVPLGQCPRSLRTSPIALAARVATRVWSACDDGCARVRRRLGGDCRVSSGIRPTAAAPQPISQPLQPPARHRTPARRSERTRRASVHLRVVRALAVDRARKKMGAVRTVGERVAAGGAAWLCSAGLRPSPRAVLCCRPSRRADGCLPLSSSARLAGCCCVRLWLRLSAIGRGERKEKGKTVGPASSSFCCLSVWFVGRRTAQRDPNSTAD